MADRADRTAVALDWLPVLVVPPVLVLDAALYSRGGPITVVTVLSAVAASLPLVLRRRVSFIILAPLMTAGIILVLWQLRPSSTVVLIPMIGLFELALNGDRRRSLTMAAAVVPFVFAGVVPFTDGHSLLSILIRNLALCLLAIAAGDVLRSRQVSAQRSELAREQETLRRLSDERLLIAREIHDVVAHAMTAINVQAGVAAHLLRRDPNQAYDALRAIKQTSGEALSELRATLDVLRDPGAGAPVAPTASLRELEPLTEGVRAAGVAVELDVGPVSDLPAAVQGAGYRIVQEALTNIARHADARTATVRVRRLDGAVTIEIDDDGHGAHAGTAIGNGVRGMRERAVALGGTLEAAPGRSGGWRVRASLPLPAQNGGSAA